MPTFLEILKSSLRSLLSRLLVEVVAVEEVVVVLLLMRAQPLWKRNLKRKKKRRWTLEEEWTCSVVKKVVEEGTIRLAVLMEMVIASSFFAVDMLFSCVLGACAIQRSISCLDLASD